MFIKIGLASEYGGSSSGVDDGYWFKLTKTFPLANCKQVKVLKINFTAKCFLPAYQGLVFSDEPFSGLLWLFDPFKIDLKMAFSSRILSTLNLKLN